MYHMTSLISAKWFLMAPGLSAGILGFQNCPTCTSIAVFQDIREVKCSGN